MPNNTSQGQKILFATSEVFPLIKTGGLADVSASLPRALLKLGHDVRIILPAYASVMNKISPSDRKKVASFSVKDESVILWQTTLPNSKVKVYLVDIPTFSEREGNPYCGPDGNDWPDNALRFYIFSRTAEAVALNQLKLKWQPNIVHCNDWQTGLIPALLSTHVQKPASVFTIHNLAYRGLFSQIDFKNLQLSEAFWHHQALEFYDQLSFIKGGLSFANAITTVSPSYAEEIQRAEFGWGLEGLLSHRKENLYGILNGVDTLEWNPAKDEHIAQTYNRRSLSKKVVNKTFLQEKLKLDTDEKIPLFGFIGRLVDQKGIELILANIPKLLEKKCQLVVLGTGFPAYESSLAQLAKKHPKQISVTLGYDEAFAHQIEAGVDLFLMPSLFEPCGLNQMYSLTYGTIPIVHGVGGLRDTVQERAPEFMDEQFNGFVFNEATAKDLGAAIDRALAIYEQPKIWKKIQLNAMQQDYSWDKSAADYEKIYQGITQGAASL